MSSNTISDILLPDNITEDKMDFPNLVMDNKMLTDIIVLGVMLIVIGIAFLIYHCKGEIKDTSKLLHAELILLITIVISLLTLIIIGAIFLTSQWSESSQALLGHLDMPKLVLVFKILVGVASVSLIILIPFLMYYHCYLGKRQRNATGGFLCDAGHARVAPAATQTQETLALCFPLRPSDSS